MIVGGRPIKILTEVVTSDGQGGFARSYAEIVTEFGMARPANGLERMRGKQMQQDVTYIVYLPPHTVAVAGCQLDVDGLLLRVGTLTDPGLLGRYMRLECSEVPDV